VTSFVSRVFSFLLLRALRLYCDADVESGHMTVVIASRPIGLLPTAFLIRIFAAAVIIVCLNNGVGFGPAPSQSPAW
jgi:hypothetical protein